MFFLPKPRLASRSQSATFSAQLTLAPFLGVLALCSVGAAQGKPAKEKPITTLRTTGRIVYVDVVVRDGYGKIVHGLKADDFLLKEKGNPQKINLFQEHSPNADGAGKVTVAANSAKGPRLISNIPDTDAKTPLDMILLDLLDTAPTDQVFARMQMVKFLRSVPPGHRVALFVLGNSLHMVQGFTSDSTELAKAAETIDPRALGRVRTASERITNNDLVGMIDSSMDGGAWGVRGNSILGAAIEKSLADEDRNDMKVRLDTTFTAFQEMARAVDGMPGRKNLYWLAGEFPSSTYFTLQSIANASTGPIGAPGLGAVRNNFTGLNAGADLGVHPFSERVDKIVADSQIAVYPIDLTGVTNDAIGAESSGVGSAGASTAGTAAAAFDERFNNRVAMHQIADDTGGEAFYGNNDPGELLKRGFEDGDNYYTLAYQPNDHNWNGQYRKISVRLNEAGYHLSYRRGYFALPMQAVGNPKTEFLAAMKLETPPSTMLTVSALPPVSLASGVMQFEATLGLGGVTFSTHANDERMARLQVMTIAYPLVAGEAPAEINNVMALGLMPDDFDAMMKSGVRLKQTLHLKPGKYVIRIGVVDTNSGRIGTLTLPFTMPEG